MVYFICIAICKILFRCFENIASGRKCNGDLSGVLCKEVVLEVYQGDIIINIMKISTLRSSIKGNIVQKSIFGSVARSIVGNIVEGALHATLRSRLRSLSLFCSLVIQ